MVELHAVIAELKRRRVFRVLIGYGVVSFAVLQIVEPIQHALGLSDAVLKLVVVLLALGFPVSLVLAWAFDINPAGIERTPPAAALRGPRLLLLLAGIGALVAAPGVMWVFLRSSTPAAGSLQAKLDAVPPASETRATPSIAVLPLVNMSSDKEQDYFSDGLSEELLNLLAQVPGLQVAARTSAFSFKGRNVKISEIGRELGVSTVLEGSVRKSGEMVRITTQLINAADGFHLWSETYDRKLTEVFAVQDEIARAVVTALKLKLLPQAAQRPVDPEAHDLVLLAGHLARQGTADAIAQAIAALEKAVAIDPGYAVAWASLAGARQVAADQDPVRFPPESTFPAAFAAAEKAIALGPDVATGWLARGGLRTNVSKDWAGARSDYERALSLSPGLAPILGALAWLDALQGQLPKAIAEARKMAAADPLVPGPWIQLSGFYLGTGELDQAESSAARALQISPGHVRALRNLGFAQLLQHHLPEARATFARLPDDGASGTMFRLMGDALVEYESGRPEESRQLVEKILSKPALFVAGSAYQLGQLYAWREDADGAFRWLDKAVALHDGGLAYLKYDPLLRKVRRDPRYAALLRRMDLPPD
jgi:TolB-like protein/Tfp pilus assembly protein PilF